MKNANKQLIDLSNGFPISEDIIYKCNICGDEFISLQPYAVDCCCRNLIIDADSGRVSIKNLDQLVAFYKD
ncbi:MAG: hypothetical protein LEGION0403_FIIPPAGN_02884 [Legionella sp.]|uniref:hypothetical protein n=1 Tax=Legionella sp. TaxID=459 RepID=UPI003D146027